MVERFVATGALAILGGLFATQPALAQQPPASEISPVARATCPLLFGPRAGAFGPNSLATVAGVVQPGVCWLELSLGFGFGTGEIRGFHHLDDDIDPMDMFGEGRYHSLTVPLGARLWFMNTHSLLADAGFGFTRYLMSADFETEYGGPYGEWDRPATALVTYLGIGYGYRFEGPQAGPRVTAVIGAFMHLTKLKESTMLTRLHPSEVEGLQRDFDSESDELADLEPYAELSASWMF